MSAYPIEDIAKACNGRLHAGRLFTGSVISNLLTDSRKFSFPRESLFFAIKGDRNDGHNYLGDLYRQHVRNFVVSSVPRNMSVFPEACFIIVPDTLPALQQISAMHRARYELPVIGITGSNGKTILKEWLFQLLHRDRVIVRSPKSYNSQVGVPLSVWQIRPDHELAIFEAGISKPGEMRFLEPVIKPGIGVITNIGKAHQEYFDNLGQKLDEKLQLFINSGTIIYCRDHKLIDEKIRACSCLKGKKLFTWGGADDADLQVTDIVDKSNMTIVRALYEGVADEITIPFTDRASIENAIHAWAVLKLLGYPHHYISANFKELSPVAMRMEQKKGINNCTVINDSYNSDPASLSIAMDFLSQQTRYKRKTLVLSDMFETGESADDLYSETGELLKSGKISRLIGIGNHVRVLQGSVPGECEFYSSTDEFLRTFQPGDFVNEAILLKGARKFGFERISVVLEEKAHSTVMEINLNRLIDNYNYFKSRLNPGTRIMAVVKAFSYGSGSHEIASALAYNLADYLAVAFFDEGVSLRRAGISLPVMVMNPDIATFPMMADNMLEPEIYSLRGLQHFIGNLREQNILNYPVHIKLETGMHRLGLSAAELPELVRIINNCRNITVRSVFSHLAAADEPLHDNFTREQIESFINMSDLVCSKLDYPVLRHILNSAGIERFPEAQFEMVRLGIGMYGISALDNTRLANVNTFKSIISNVKNVPAGGSVGYSRAFMAGCDSRIAVIPVGYADGLDRRLGNGVGKMMVNGVFVPVAGNICMDMCMLDITGTDAREGDEVIIFGEDYSISDIAALLSTIPYEIFTNISDRVKRVYVRE